MIEILSFIVVLGALIFVHELGHFAVAKWVGIRVEQFSLGFPPKLYGFKWGETEYRICWIPLGGYVKMSGDRPEVAAISGAPYEFMSKKPWQRTLVILAGPAMNYLLALVVLIGIYFYQGEPVVDNDHAIIGAVMEDSPAEKVGLREKDVILLVDDSTVTDFVSLSQYVSQRPAQSIHLTWRRGGDTLQATVTTWADSVLNLQGEMEVVGRIGARQNFTYKPLSISRAIVAGFRLTNFYGGMILKTIRDVITGSVSTKMLGGPIFIAQVVGQAARQGLVSVLLLAAIISVNLAVINLVPIPVLDGGQLLFLVMEKIKGSPVSIKTRALMQQVGVFLLIALTIFIVRNDISRIMEFGW
ncbi:MAG: RIP metalloprotease RseP [candidate division Zixibacteria bacterium]|nr:RIP metalloprotease RseP [candidate division Zixibacteria bacterium]